MSPNFFQFFSKVISSSWLYKNGDGLVGFGCHLQMLDFNDMRGRVWGGVRGGRGGGCFLILSLELSTHMPLSHQGPGLPLPKIEAM